MRADLPPGERGYDAPHPSPRPPGERGGKLLLID